MRRKGLVSLMLGTSVLAAIPDLAKAQQPQCGGELVDAAFPGMGFSAKLPNDYTILKIDTLGDQFTLEAADWRADPVKVELEIRPYGSCRYELSEYLSEPEKTQLELDEKAGTSIDRTVHFTRQNGRMVAERCIHLHDDGATASLKVLIPPSKTKTCMPFADQMLQSMKLSDLRSPVPADYVPFANTLKGCGIDAYGPGDGQGRRPSSGMMPGDWTATYERDGIDDFTSSCRTILTSPRGSKIVIAQEEKDRRFTVAIEDVAQRMLQDCVESTGVSAESVIDHSYFFMGAQEYHRSRHGPYNMACKVEGMFSTPDKRRLYVASITSFEQGWPYSRLVDSGPERYPLPRLLVVFEVIPADAMKTDKPHVDNILRSLKY